MKTLYLIKPFLPLGFLPIAPGVVQNELVRQGVINHGGAVVTIGIQIICTVAILLWVVRTTQKKKCEAKAFLKMSCVSKKVYHDGRWMTVEKYLADQHNIVVSHGMTPEESQAWLHDSEKWLRNERASNATSDARESIPSGNYAMHFEQRAVEDHSIMFVE